LGLSSGLSRVKLRVKQGLSRVNKLYIIFSNFFPILYSIYHLYYVFYRVFTISILKYKR